MYCYAVLPVHLSFFDVIVYIYSNIIKMLVDYYISLFNLWAPGFQIINCQLVYVEKIELLYK